MSVDFVVSIERPVAMAAVIEAASRTLGELLAIRDVPRLTLVGGPEDTGGVLLSGGCYLTMGVAGFLDRTWVLGHPDEEGSSVLVAVSPVRTCVGVVLATGIGLAAAIAGRGAIVQDEVGMVRPPLEDPSAFVERTRLSEVGEGFAGQCERFMRQFPHLNEWPPDRCAVSDRAPGEVPL